MSKAMGVSIVLGATLGVSVGSTFSTVDARVKNLRGNLKELQAVSTRSAALVTAEARLQAAQQAQADGPTARTKRELVAVQTAYSSAEKAARKYNITVAGAAEATAAINKQRAALASMENFQAHQSKRAELKGGMMGMVAGMFAAGGITKLGMDYDKGMARVKRKAHFDDVGFKDFKKQALALGGNLEDTAAIASQGATAVPQNELIHFIAVGKQMAKVFEVSGAETGEALRGIRIHFKLNEVQADAYVDKLVHLSNHMNASAPELLEYAHRTADIGKQYGVTSEQIVALGATMSGLQIPAKQAVSATQSIFETLGPAKGASKEVQHAFGMIGKSGKQIQADFRKDAQGTMLNILEHLKNRYTGSARISVAKAMFGSDHATVIKMVEGLDEYKKAISLAGDATGSAGALQATYKDITETASAAVERLSSKVTQIGTAMGESNLPLVSWVMNAGGGLLDTVFALVTGFPAVTSTVVGFSTALVGLSLAAKGGKYAATLFSDSWSIYKDVLNALRPSVLANRAAIIGQAAATVVNRAVILACAAGTKIMTVAQWAFNSALWANPITWFVVGVLALVAGMVLLYQKCEPVRRIFNGLGEDFGEVFSSMSKDLTELWDKTVQFFEGLADKFAWVSEAASSVKGFFSSVGLFGDSEEKKIVAKPVVRPAATMPLQTVAAHSSSVGSGTVRGNTQLQPSAVPAIRPATGASSGGSISPQITFSLNFNGVPSKDVGEILVGAIRTKEQEIAAYFEKMIASIASNQRRLAYDR